MSALSHSACSFARQTSPDFGRPGFVIHDTGDEEAGRRHRLVG
jgi:hypothetical protein